VATTVLWVVLEAFWVVNSQTEATIMLVDTAKAVPWVLSVAC